MSDDVTAAFQVAIGDRMPPEALADALSDFNLERFLKDDGTVDTERVERRAASLSSPRAGRSELAREWLRKRGIDPTKGG